MRARTAVVAACLVTLLGASGCLVQAGGGTDFDAIATPPEIGYDVDLSRYGDDDDPPETGGDLADPGGPLPPGLDEVDAPEGSVAALQLLAEQLGCNPSGIEDLQAGVSVTGAVVTSPEFSASSSGLEGYYVSDPGGGPWHGILVVFDADAPVQLQPGSVLDVTGTLEEAWCGTQLRAGSWDVTGTADVPPPAQLPTALSEPEPYEDVLVRAENVLVLEHFTSNPNKGQYLLDNGLYASFDFAIGTDFYLSLEVGARYDLTGVIRYSFDEYRLNPRNGSDVALVAEGSPDDTGGDPEQQDVTLISDVQMSPESADCTANSIENHASGLVVEGTVVTPRWEAASDLWAYALSDGTATPWSGLQVTVDASIDGDFQIGDVLRVWGEHTEFYCMTQLDADQVDAIGTAQPPAPVEVEDLAASPEQWEAVVVEVSDVTVTANDDWSSFGQVETDQGFLVDRELLGFDAIDEPAVGTLWSTVRGVVRYGFGEYRLSPRTPDDLIAAE